MSCSIDIDTSSQCCKTFIIAIVAITESSWSFFNGEHKQHSLPSPQTLNQA
jgi:hypothetical protein